MRAMPIPARCPRLNANSSGRSLPRGVDLRASRAVDAASSSVSEQTTIEDAAATGAATQGGRAPAETRARPGDENMASVVKAGSNSLPPTSQPQGAPIRYAMGELPAAYARGAPIRPGRSGVRRDLPAAPRPAATCRCLAGRSATDPGSSRPRVGQVRRPSRRHESSCLDPKAKMRCCSPSARRGSGPQRRRPTQTPVPG
jgi:hypothetical protein